MAIQGCAGCWRLAPCIQLADDRFYEPHRCWMDVIELIKKGLKNLKKDLEDGVYYWDWRESNIVLVQPRAAVDVGV